KRDSRFEVLRRNNIIGDGRVENLQSGKLSIPVVEETQEFGAFTNSSITITENDILDVFEEETIKRSL
ncbi:MAG: hypothetical protein AAB795_03980, partial [Patescibacteria group bacterium]